jgi:hypothetical protein
MNSNKIELNLMQLQVNAEAEKSAALEEKFQLTHELAD